MNSIAQRRRRRDVNVALSPCHRAHLHRDIPRQVGRTQQLGDFNHGHALAVRVLAAVDEYVAVVAVLGRGQMQTRHRQQIPVHLDSLARPRGRERCSSPGLGPSWLPRASSLGAGRFSSRTALTRESASRSASRRSAAVASHPSPRKKREKCRTLSATPCSRDYRYLRLTGAISDV